MIAEMVVVRFWMLWLGELSVRMGAVGLSDHQLQLLQDLDELGFPVSTIAMNGVTPELMPNEVIIDIPDEDDEGEWELPDPYLHGVDKFTHDDH
eukprot:6463468-Amphidinium_carterae.2